MANPSVPLPLLQSKNVPYEWHDGVALVGQLVSQLRLASGLAEPGSVPSLDGISLTSAGTLAIAPDQATAQPDMPGTAQLLQQLLSGTDQPPQLRLFAMQTATAEPPASFSVFADEVSKWERPNRAQKLTQLYARAVEHIGVEHLTAEARAKAERAALNKVRNPPRRIEAERRGAEPAVRRPSGPLTTIVTGLAIVAAAAAIAAVEWRYVLGHNPATVVPSIEEPAVLDAETPAPVRSTTSRVIAPAGGRRDGTTPVPPGESSSSADTSEQVIAAQSELTRAQGLFVQQDYVAARAVFERVLESLRNEQSPQADEIRQAARNLGEVANAAVSSAVSREEYRVGDAGVSPPVPQAYMPPKPDPRTPPEALQVMEVRVNADGAVDSAKFVINRPSFRNSWWPAAAKAWRFKPAMKDGRPVRYVMRIVMDDTAGQR